jgi:tetratricopeptide (TPR) repeat protein
VELTAELISTRDGFHLWAGRFPTSPRSLDEAEDEIVVAVLRNLRITPRGGLEAAMRHSPPPDPEAHRLFLEASVFWNQRTYEALQQAIALYEKAIKIDPGYAQAYAGLAECHGVIAANGLADSRETADQGRGAAQRAIEIDPTVAEAHAALGLIQSAVDWDWPGAEARFQRAIALNPNSANAHQWRAHNLLWQGRFSEARHAIRKALDLDSLSLVILSNQAVFAYLMHDFDEALRLYDRTLAVDPGFISAANERGMTLSQLGRMPEAIASFERARAITKAEASPAVGLAMTYARLGRKDEALRILAQLQNAGAPHISHFQAAVVYAALGDIERGIGELELSYRDREAFLIALKIHPDLDPLRRDPRFAALQKKMRLD